MTRFLFITLTMFSILLNNNAFSKTHFPSFELESVADSDVMVRLSELEHPIVIVNFWASWCFICKGEMGDLLNLAESMNGKLALVNVSIDARQADAEKAVHNFEDKHVNFQNENAYFLWDKTKEFSFKQLNVSKVPEAYILIKGDTGFEIYRKVVGKYKWNSKSTIKKLNALTSM
jgi:thiol-disulfide isomerase/thioredoxin